AQATPRRPPGRPGRADRAVAHQLLGRPFGSAGGWTVPPAPEFCLALPAGPAPATLASAFPDATRRNRAEADLFLLASCLPSEGGVRGALSAGGQAPDRGWADEHAAAVKGSGHHLCGGIRLRLLPRGGCGRGLSDEGGHRGRLGYVDGVTGGDLDGGGTGP